jgi:hypothetical protein
MINQKGMTEKELLELCSGENHRMFPLAPYWPAEVYGFGKQIREYGYYPSFLPLCIYSDHGIGSMDGPAKHELESDAPCQFYFTPRKTEIWKKISKKPCYVMYSPYVFYRKKHKIEKSPDAKGTIAFMAHTTSSLDDELDVEVYVKQLLALPEKFHPISVCMHQVDIMKGQYKKFFQYNIPVFTVGGNSPLFVERFYDLLKNFSFATSNEVGSYLYYAVEMGIPFFIYGDPPKFINRYDPNITKGSYDQYKEFEYYRKVYDMFKGLNTEITAEQCNLVERELGLTEGLSRKKMAYVLYLSFFQWLFSKAFWWTLSKKIRRLRE